MPIIKSSKRHAELASHIEERDSGNNLFIAAYGIEGRRVSFRLADIVSHRFPPMAVGIYSIFQLETMQAGARPSYTMLPDVVYMLLGTKLTGQIYYSGTDFKINIFNASLPPIKDTIVRKAINKDKYAAIASIMNKMSAGKSFMTRYMRGGAANINTSGNYWFSIYGPKSRNVPKLKFSLRSFKFGATFEEESNMPNDRGIDKVLLLGYDTNKMITYRG